VKKDIFDLITRVGQADKAVVSSEVFASVAHNCRRIRTKVSGMVREFNIPRQKDSGLRIFLPTTSSDAKYVRDANPDEVRQYLDLLPKVHLILVYRDDHHWYGFPANQEAFRRKVGDPCLVVVHNADNIDQFDHLVTRYDGACFWYDDVDYRVDPERPTGLRDALKARDWTRVTRSMLEDPRTYDLEVKGASPEDCIAYQIAARRIVQETKTTVESRLESALVDVHAKLDSFTERGDNLEVRWVNASGQGYTTVIRKDDFKVVTAGICVSGEDRKFDLKSLVGVVTHAEKERRVVRIGHGGMNEEQYFGAHPEPRDLGERGGNHRRDWDDEED